MFLIHLVSVSYTHMFALSVLRYILWQYLGNKSQMSNMAWAVGPQRLIGCFHSYYFPVNTLEDAKAATALRGVKMGGWIHSPQVSLRIHLAALSHFWQDLDILYQIHHYWSLLWVPPRTLTASRPQWAMNLAKGEKLLANGKKVHKGVQGNWMSGTYF